ncbi:MAG TPA: cytochrome c biogenesis protein CcdA [Vicinamibacterales bacterium]|jgi:thioredoxin:protein disulfide reductase|nr:cytochrome c biogenesis protein CcdA [Vicinamibacterales bacterium]
MMRARRAVVLCVLCFLCVLCAREARAQLRRPRAEVTPLVERPAVRAGERARVALKVSLPEGLHTQSNKPRDPLLIPTELVIEAPAGIAAEEIVWPPSTDFAQAGQEKPLAVFEHEFAIGVELSIAPTASGDVEVPAKLRYQACDVNLCYPPQTAPVVWRFHVVPASASSPPPDPAMASTFASIKFGRGEKPGAGGSEGSQGSLGAESSKGSGAADGLAKLDQFTVLGTTGGYLGADDFLKFVHDAETGVKPRGMFEGRGPLMIVLLVLIGGLALNLTPCVLPMIPINLAIIGAGSQVGFDRGFPSRMRGFVLGAVYGGAMAVVYGVLGLVVILTAGTFGTINASPWFNAGIAILFVVLGLAMFDVIMIDFSSLSSRFRPEARTGSFILAFSMGAVAALLAGACVAPVVIQVVLFSSNLYATGTKVALALPFVLGLGMAIPWPIAGAGLAALPKPGMWMVRVKQGFGVVILATAAYYGYEAYSILSNRWVDAADVKSSVEEQLKAGWHASLADGLDTAAREGKPVLIDMWATWCKNCLTMDKTTLNNAAVQSALSGYVKIKFQAEDPDAQPAKSVMQKFDAVGLPTYVILRPR